jgi:sn-glycerol 3-phosphate transport system ATP-binding protein
LRFADGSRRLPDGQALTIGIRPEHVQVAPDGMPLAVDLVEPMGSEMLVHGRLAGPGEPPLVVRVTTGTPIGETLSVRLPAEHLHVFDRASGRRIDPDGHENAAARVEAAQAAD